MDLTGSVAVVTGGGSGLGRATVETLAASHADICISYCDDRAAAEEAHKAVEALGRRAAIVHLDQSDPASVNSAVDCTIERLGRLDILINNAGTSVPVPFPDLAALAPDVWDRVINTNLRGPFLLARAAAPHLRESAIGRIVNVGAMIGLEPMGSSIAQAVSKAGVIHLTRCLAVAFAPDVTVNCVAPGLMEGTRMAQRLPTASVDALRERSLLKHNTSIRDVADQIVHFCGAESVTGQTLVIDGGIHFH